RKEGRRVKGQEGGRSGQPADPAGAKNLTAAPRPAAKTMPWRSVLMARSAAARLAATLALAALALPLAARADDKPVRPRLFTHESYVEEATRVTELPIN